MEFKGLKSYEIPLKLPLLILKGNKGLLACGYLSVETFNRTGEVAAIVTGVKNFDDMSAATVKTVSEAGAYLGLKPGMTGAEVLDLIR
jgi:uncharacterized protein YunC (DUF1805 family)